MKIVRSDLVKAKFPELFYLILLFAILINKPGEALPRFVAQKCPVPVNYSSADHVIGLQMLKDVGEQATAMLQSLCPLRTSFIAGGAIVDLSDEETISLQANYPDLLIEDLQQPLLPITTRSAVNAGKTDSKALWNYNIAGVTWLKNQGFTGRGTRLGVIANEYAYDHVALLGRIKEVKTIGQKSRSAVDLHLVHPLGILTGNDEGRFTGIAPETEVSLALLSAQTAKADTMLTAIEWMTALPEPPGVILICTDFANTAPLAIARALTACRNVGIIPIIAAGNNPNQITGMAALPSCVTIAAIDRWQQRALYSGQGPAIFDGQKILKPDFSAPGSAIYGPADLKEYKLGSGTLQAAAHFAGLFLLMRQARPETDPEYMLSIMRITCQDLGETGADYQTGAGLPVPSAALTYIDNPPQNQ